MMAAKGKKERIKKAVPSLAELEAAKEAGKKKYRNAKRTDSAYLGYIKRGKEFLGKLVEGLRKTAKGDEDSEIRMKKCADAFENPPNEYSVEMLEHWMVQKCFNEDLGKSMAEGIHAAFIRHWDSMSVSCLFW
jgi:hypothetical protein